MKRHVIIVGGGASGMAAAIAAAESGAGVTILEHTDRVGKKILSTGNGRCNLTNRRMEADCYRGEEPGFPMEGLALFGPSETLDWFRRMGLEVKERQGYYYPASDQASAVLDVLRMRLRELGVFVACGFEPERISRERGRWRVLGVWTPPEEAPEGRKEKGKAEAAGGKKRSFEGDAVILAAGSKAAPNTGSDGSGYQLAKALGHRVIRPLPALVQLRCQGNCYRQLAGIRTDAVLTLYADGAKAVQDRGELQLTDYGLSGIPAFQISRFASRALDERKRVTVRVDFLPGKSRGETMAFLEERKSRFADRTGEEFLVGVLNKKLALVLLKLAGIRPSDPVRGVSRKQLEALCGQIKGYEALVQSVNPFANAQICCGGAATEQIHPLTMESRLHSGLYFAGELMDVDGICGGYNLQWAWTSGILAGRAAAGSPEEKGNGRESGQKRKESPEAHGKTRGGRP